MGSSKDHFCFLRVRYPEVGNIFANISMKTKYFSKIFWGIAQGPRYYRFMQKVPNYVWHLDSRPGMMFVTWIPCLEWCFAPGFQTQNDVWRLDSRPVMMFGAGDQGTEWCLAPGFQARMKFDAWIPGPEWCLGPGFQARNDVWCRVSRQRMMFGTWFPGTEWFLVPGIKA